jgi:hypothetical protein
MRQTDAVGPGSYRVAGRVHQLHPESNKHALCGATLMGFYQLQEVIHVYGKEKNQLSDTVGHAVG